MLKLLSFKKSSDSSSESHFYFTSLKTEIKSLFGVLRLFVINNLNKNISKNYDEMGIMQDILKLHTTWGFNIS